MKAFKVIYQHGHFIDKDSNKRIVPVQGAEYIITAKENAFTEEDAKLKMEVPLTPQEKALWAENEFGKNNYGKIMNAGDQFFFRIGNSRTLQGDESRQYIFICAVLEDLYLYLIKGKKGEDAEDWRLADCKCALEKCLLGGLTLTEKIPAESLNKLFSHTVMFYFSMQRSGSANAFNTFFKYKQGMDITFDGATNQRYNGLGKERERFVAAKRKATILFH